MLPRRAVDMQKQGMSAKQIAAELGVCVNQVVGWYKTMGYDPVHYHWPTLLERVREGNSLKASCASVGLATGSSVKKLSGLLQSGGIEKVAKAAKRRQVVTGHCQVCDILLVPYDAGCAEQRHWQNGTRDGVVCTFCEGRMAA